MSTPTTPCALFEHVPLSECRNAFRATAGYWHSPQVDPARRFIRQVWYERALAAVSNQLKLVTAERDELRRELDAMRGEL